MPQPKIFLTPASNETAIANLKDTVRDGINYDDFRRYIERDVTNETLRIWRTKETHAKRYDFNRGDIMLFYTGDRVYTDAAVIRETNVNENLANALWDHEHGDPNQDSESWKHVIYLDRPFDVNIEGSLIADYADYNIEYVMALQPLSDEGHEAIREEYDTKGGIPGFIIDHSNLSRKEISHHSPLFDEHLDEVGEPTPPEPEQVGLPTSDRWQERVELLSKHLDQTNQVILRGPNMAISRGQARQFASRYLSESGDRIDDRLIEASIDEATTYQDLVEDIIANVDTNTGITTTDGVFKRACRLAHADKNEAEYEGETVPEYVLLVELRGDITLGDTLGSIAYLLDPDNRRREHKIQLPHSGETLCIPDNINLLLVDAGKSLKSISDETRRRFRVIEFEPDLDILGEVYNGDTHEDYPSSQDEMNVPPDGGLTVTALDELNQHLANQSDTGKKIGQDYFINYANTDVKSNNNLDPGQYDRNTLLDIWVYEVLPYLRTNLSEPETLINKSGAVQEIIRCHEDNAELTDASETIRTSMGSSLNK